MDITPLIREGANVITGYGNNSFSINQQKYEGSIFLLPSSVTSISSLHLDTIDLSIIELLERYKPQIDLLLIGCGLIHRSTPPSLKALGLPCETMTTGAACRTYNVLLTEERKVAALLVAV